MLFVAGVPVSAVLVNVSTELLRQLLLLSNSTHRFSSKDVNTLLSASVNLTEVRTVTSYQPAAAALASCLCLSCLSVANRMAGVVMLSTVLYTAVATSVCL